MFRRFRERIETEQGSPVRPLPPRQPALDFGVEADARGQPILPLASSAAALRSTGLAPGLASATRQRPRDMLEVPSLRERDLRRQLGQAVVAQVVEDEMARRIPRAVGGHHAYAAALKRVMGKGMAEMMPEELEATLA